MKIVVKKVPKPLCGIVKLIFFFFYEQKGVLR